MIECLNDLLVIFFSTFKFKLRHTEQPDTQHNAHGNRQMIIIAVQSNLLLSYMNPQQKLFLKNRTVTDPIIIKKYEAEFGYNFFYPKYEEEGIDVSIITKKIYTKSQAVIGERVPILVAVNPHDPFFNHPKFRIHGRIIDGKHKCLDSKTSKTRWTVHYVFIESYSEFVDIWLYSDVSKSEQATNIQLRQRIEDYCELLWVQKPEQIKDHKGIFQKHKIGALAIKKFEGQKKRVMLYKYIPKEYLNQKISRAIISRNHIKPKSKKDLELYKVIQERDQLMITNSELRLQSKPETEKDIIIKEKERQISKLKLCNSNVKSYLKEERKKRKLDQTEKHFEVWWSKFEG